MLGWELPPNNSGGLGVACLALCKTLSQKGVSIQFVLPYKADHGIDFMDVIASSNNLPSRIFGAYDSSQFLPGLSAEDLSSASDIFAIESQYQNKVRKIVKERTFDLIHAHDWLTFRAGLRARELSGKPLILHVHSVESDRAGSKQGNPLVHEIEELGLTLADHIVAVSELTKQKIVHNYHIPADKITVAHNSIDREHIAPLDPINTYHYLSNLKSQGYKVVVSIGRLTIQKGLYNFLGAAARVVSHQPKTIFLIVGSGELEHELISRSAELGIGRNVLFIGFQRGKQWRDAFAIADLFVMPSVSEPFGLTPLEAIGYGTPVLISKQSGVSEVLMNCLKTDYWDTDKMANDITAVLRYHTLQQTLAANAVQELASLSWHNTADKLMNIYRTHIPAGAAV